MTAEEYSKRKRFEVKHSVDFDSFAKRLSLPLDTIFEAHSIIWGGIYLVKIHCEFAELAFDLRECDQNGELIRGGYRRGRIRRYEIAECLYQGDWRFYTNFEQKKVKIRNTVAEN